MTQNIKLRYVNEIAGAFVVICALLLMAGIYVAGHAQGWFEPTFVLRTTFLTKEGTFGLQEGAEIRILGALAGRVGPIYPIESGGMETTLIMRDRFRPLVRVDSMAKVKKKYTIMGDSFVEITLGDPKLVPMENNTYIRCEKDEELIQAAQKTVDEVRATLVPILEEFQHSLSNISRITASIDAGEGFAGRLLKDKTMADDAQKTVQEIRRTAESLPGSAEKLDAVMDDLKKASGSLADETDTILKDLQVLSSSLTGEVSGVHAVLYRTEATLRETQRLIEGLQRHWLVRGYMEERAGTELLDPAEMRNRRGAAP